MPTILQSVVSSFIWGPATSVQKTFASACTPGSRIVIVATQENQGGTFTVSDPTNGTYSSVDSEGSGGSGGTGSGKTTIRSIVNTASTALTVTVAVGSSTGGSFTLYELSACTLDEGASALGGSSTALTGSVDVPANALILAGGTYYSGGGVVDSGYTAAAAEASYSNSYHFHEYDEDAGSAGTKTLTFGLVGARDNWSMAIAAYADGGGSPVLMGQASL